MLSFLGFFDTLLSPSHLSNPLPFSHWQLLINCLPLNSLTHPLQCAKWRSSATNNPSMAMCSLKWVLSSPLGRQVPPVSLSTRHREVTRLSAHLTFHVWSLVGGKNCFAGCLPSPETTSSSTVQGKLFHCKDLMGEGQSTAETDVILGHFQLSLLYWGVWKQLLLWNNKDEFYEN